MKGDALMFNSIGNLHNYESQILLEIAKTLVDRAEEAHQIYENYQEITEEISLNSNQHKVLAFLFSIYHLDQSSKQKHTQNLTEITHSLTSSSTRGDRFMRACQKLVRLGLIEKNDERQYYITKYGIFFMYNECQEREWGGELVANATLAAIEKETNKQIRNFISEKLQEDERKDIVLGENEEKEADGDDEDED